MDTRVPRMLHDTEGGIAKSNHPQVPDPQASYTLCMDASKYAYAGVLTQTHEDTDHPTAYVSGLFRESQLNWAALTKEAYTLLI